MNIVLFKGKFEEALFLFNLPRVVGVDENGNEIKANTVVGVLNVLLQKEYIAGFKVIDGQNNKKTIQVELKYDDNDRSVINEITRVSKPGRRVYKSASEIKNFKNG